MAIVLNAKMLPAVLSVIAGSIDAISFLGLGGLFTAHVTGNLVVLVAHLATGSRAPVANILSVPVFVAVLGLTGMVVVVPVMIAVVVLACCCGLGAACETAIGLMSLALPVGLAVLAVALGNATVEASEDP